MKEFEYYLNESIQGRLKEIFNKDLNNEEKKINNKLKIKDSIRENSIKIEEEILNEVLKLDDSINIKFFSNASKSDLENMVIFDKDYDKLKIRNNLKNILVINMTNFEKPFIEKEDEKTFIYTRKFVPIRNAINKKLYQIINKTYKKYKIPKNQDDFNIIFIVRNDFWNYSERPATHDSRKPFFITTKFDDNSYLKMAIKT